MSASAAAEAQEEVGTTRALLVLRDHAENPWKTTRQLAVEHGYRSKTSVERILNGVARLDGRSGRPTLLSTDAERRVLDEILTLTISGAAVGFPQVVEIVKAAYFAENHRVLPVVGKHLLARIAHRHGQRLRLVPVVGEPLQRRLATTRNKVNDALQGFKAIFRRHFSGSLDPSMIIFVDETHVNRNNKQTKGRPAIQVGNVRPTHSIPSDSENMTLVPFFDGNGTCVLTSYVVEGAPQVIDASSVRLANFLKDSGGSVQLMFTPSGEIGGDRPDGLGSWHMMAEAFRRRFEQLYGKWEQPVNQPKRFRGVLFLDGCSVHNEIGAIKEFDAAGLIVVRIPPHLTHVLQVADNGHIFGKLMERVRSVASSLAARFQLVPWEVFVQEIHKCLVGTLTRSALAAAFEETGFYFKTDGSVGLSDESISRMLDKLASQGRFVRSLLDSPLGGMSLRNRFVLQLDRFVREGVRAGLFSRDMRSFVTPEVVEATARAADLIPRRTRAPTAHIVGSLQMGQRRVPLPLSAMHPNTRRGTIVLNPDGFDDVSAVVQGTGKRGVGAPRGPRTVRPAVVPQDREKMAKLAEMLPGYDLNTYPVQVKKFLVGKKDLANTVRRIKQVFVARTRAPRSARQKAEHEHEADDRSGVEE